MPATSAERLSQMWLMSQRVVLWSAGAFVVGMVWRSLASESDWLAQTASRGLTAAAAVAVAAVSIWIVYSLAYRPAYVPILVAGGLLLVAWQMAHLAEFLTGEPAGLWFRTLRLGAGWTGSGLLLAAFYLSLVEAAIARARLEHESSELHREIEQRSRAEEALRLARDQLEERVTQRTSELRSANQQLQREVTEHALTADNLLRSEARFRHITASTGEWIWEMDAFGRFTYCSQALSDLLGYSPEEVIGISCTRLLAPGEAAPLPGQDVGDAPVRLTRWHLHRDGRPLLLESAAAAVCDSGGMILGYHGATRDITVRYQLERQVEQTRNMEMVGQLASGVAHDFNNLVGVMLGCCDSARQTLEPNHRAEPMLGVLEEAAQQATSLTQSLLLLGSHRAVELQSVDLASTLEQTRRLLQHLLPSEIELELATPEGAVWVEADATQVQQALLNMAVNARDAMPNGGRLKIQLTLLATEQLRDPPPVLVQAGSYARLEIADTGCGIPAEAQARIFDPFYTTKARGQGTGLGLAIVDSIIKNHGGWIRVRSVLGQGTTFSLFLPGAKAPAGHPTAAAPQTVVADVAVLTSPEHRLMRGIVATQLRAQGHRVAVLAGVDELVSALVQDPTAIRLLVVDSGQTEELWDQWPAIRARKSDLLLLILADGGELPPPDDARTLSLSVPFDAARFAQCVDVILSAEKGSDDEHHRSPGGRPCPVTADSGVSPES